MKLASRLAGAASALGIAAAHVVADDQEEQRGSTDVVTPPEDDEDEQDQAATERKPGAEAVETVGAEAEVVETNAVATVSLSERDVAMQGQGRAEMHQRIETVFASEHIAGREQAAAMLLAADVPAETIVAKLGKLPKGDSGNAMLDSLRTQASGAPALKPAGESEQPKAGAVWDRVGEKQGWGPKADKK